MVSCYEMALDQLRISSQWIYIPAFPLPFVPGSEQTFKPLAIQDIEQL